MERCLLESRVVMGHCYQLVTVAGLRETARSQGAASPGLGVNPHVTRVRVLWKVLDTWGGRELVPVAM